jgi:hypothetical protein
LSATDGCAGLEHSDQLGELNQIDNVQAKALRHAATPLTAIRFCAVGTGGLEGAGLVPTAEYACAKYLTIELGSISQDIVFRALLCQVDQQQWQINARASCSAPSTKGLAFEAQQ